MAVTQRTEAEALLIAQLTATLGADSYARKVIKEAETLGELVDDSPAAHPGWRHYRGRLVEDGSAVCGRCDSKKVYTGDCVYTGEYVPYAEAVEDPVNFYANRERYNVCLGCAHVGHFPPKEASR